MRAHAKALLILAVAAAAALVAAGPAPCFKKTSEPVIGHGTELYRRAGAGDPVYSGAITLSLSPEEGVMRVTFDVAGFGQLHPPENEAYVLEETHLWLEVGDDTLVTSAADFKDTSLPTTRRGTMIGGLFPYRTGSAGGPTITVTVGLNSLGVYCPFGSTSRLGLLLAATATVSVVDRDTGAVLREEALATYQSAFASGLPGSFGTPATMPLTCDCATCSDGEWNGDEYAVDCGGATCAPCEANYDGGAVNEFKTSFFYPAGCAGNPEYTAQLVAACGDACGQIAGGGVYNTREAYCSGDEFTCFCDDGKQPPAA